MNAKPPLGILILAALAFLAGFWRLLQSCAALWWSSRAVMIGGLTDSNLAVGIGFDLLCLGMFGLLIAVAWLVIADALYSLQAWAWQLAAILAGVSVLFAGLEMVVSVLDRGRGDFPWGSVVALALNGLALWYLLRVDVRSAFGAPETGESEAPAGASGEGQN